MEERKKGSSTIVDRGGYIGPRGRINPELVRYPLIFPTVAPESGANPDAHDDLNASPVDEKKDSPNA